MDLDQLKEQVKPAGFYNQKAVYLQALSSLLTEYQDQSTLPSRQELLACKGIGKETADSILVYCFQQPVPIVGTYTRRFFARIRGDVSYLRKRYETIQQEQSKELPKNPEILARFHALVVCHGQNSCQKSLPRCSTCFLQSKCMYGQNYETDPAIARIQDLISPPKKNPGT